MAESDQWPVNCTNENTLLIEILIINRSGGVCVAGPVNYERIPNVAIIQTGSKHVITARDGWCGLKPYSIRNISIPEFRRKERCSKGQLHVWQRAISFVPRQFTCVL